jgi:hypothetical protein
VTLQECTAILTPLALALRAEMDVPTYRAYHRMLKDVPVVLADAALTELGTSGLRFMPSAPEILAASERVRRRLLAAHPYEGCAECEHQRGYRSILLEGRQKTVEECPCKGRHLERLAGMGIVEPCAQLPGEAGVGENEQVYPTMAQLPEHLKRQIAAVAGQKVLR